MEKAWAGAKGQRELDVNEEPSAVVVPKMDPSALVSPSAIGDVSTIDPLRGIS